MESLRWSARGFLSSKAGMVITLVAALVGTTAIGFAAATTAGVIHACVNNNSGTIRIVSATTACTNNEVALAWNTEGPEGATGPVGPSDGWDASAVGTVPIGGSDVVLAGQGS